MVRGLIWYFIYFLLIDWRQMMSHLGLQVRKACSMYNWFHSQPYTNLQKDKQQIWPLTHFGFSNTIRRILLLYLFLDAILGSYEVRWSSKWQIGRGWVLDVRKFLSSKKSDGPVYTSSKTSFSHPFSRKWFWNCPTFCLQKSGDFGWFWYSIWSLLTIVGTRNTGICDTKKIQHLGNAKCSSWVVLRPTIPWILGFKHSLQDFATIHSMTPGYIIACFWSQTTTPFHFLQTKWQGTLWMASQLFWPQRLHLLRQICRWVVWKMGWGPPGYMVKAPCRSSSWWPIFFDLEEVSWLAGQMGRCSKKLQEIRNWTVKFGMSIWWHFIPALVDFDAHFAWLHLHVCSLHGLFDCFWSHPRIWRSHGQEPPLFWWENAHTHITYIYISLHIYIYISI